jgi:iron(III) transport system substrate-binding protein
MPLEDPMEKISSKRRQTVALSAAMMLGLPGARAQAPFDRGRLIDAARKEGQMVFYSTIPEQQNNEILAKFQEKYPFIKTSSYRATSGRLAARLDAEIAAGKVLGDTLQMGAFGRFLDYANAGQLDRFVTPEMDAYGPQAKDHGLWTLFRVSPILMAYDSKRTTGDAIPTSWEDLTNPKYKGRIVLLDATSGGQQAHWYALRQHLGPDYWKRVAANGAVAMPGVNRAMDAVLAREFDLAGHVYGYTVIAYQKSGAPVKHVLPKEGVPIMISPIAVLKGGPNPNAGRLFVDWILSAEGQAAIVRIMNDYSLRPDAPAPEGLPPYKDLKVLAPDSWAKVAASEKAFGEEWSSLFVKKQ